MTMHLEQRSYPRRVLSLTRLLKVVGIVRSPNRYALGIQTTGSAMPSTSSIYNEPVRKKRISQTTLQVAIASGETDSIQLSEFYREGGAPPQLNILHCPFAFRIIDGGVENGFCWKKENEQSH